MLAGIELIVPAPFKIVSIKLVPSINTNKLFNIENPSIFL
jgi:hypothetical protein